MGHHFLKPCDFTVISISKVLHFVKVKGCETFKQRVAQKIGNGWDARVTVMPALMYSTIFYSRDKQTCKYCLDFIDTATINQQTTPLIDLGKSTTGVYCYVQHTIDTPTINQQTTDNTLDWVGLVYHQSVWAWKAHLRSVLLCSTHHASSKRELFRILQELMGPAIRSSAFWVSKGLRALKILSAISMLYNQKYCYATYGIYDNVIYPPSNAGFLFRGRWAQGCHNVWYTLQHYQSHWGGKGRKHTHSDLCWWGGGPLPQS